MKKILSFVLFLASTNVIAECMTGEIGSLTIEPKAGYMEAMYAGTARFSIKDQGGSVVYSYISESQQNFNHLYSAVLTAKTSKANVEVCWDNNAVLGSYKRMNRLILN